MIGRLRGAVVEMAEDGSVVVDVHGVGYEVHLPLGTLGRVEGHDGATFFVHTHVREDAITLFGFDSAADRHAFRALLGVSGVGPKVALSILGRLSAERLAEAIAREDKAAFKGISGVGRKTVERLFLDLKDKLPVGAGAARAARAPKAAPPPDSTTESVIGALVQMGYKRPEVERALEALPPELLELPLEELLRKTLSALA